MKTLPAVIGGMAIAVLCRCDAARLSLSGVGAVMVRAAGPARGNGAAGSDGPGGWSTPDREPAPRFGALAVVDTIDDRLIILGGPANDVWAFSLGNDQGWTRLEPTGQPPPQLTPELNQSQVTFGNHLLFDADRHRLLLVDPLGSRIDVLQLGGPPAWSHLEIPTNGRVFAWAVIDRARHRLLGVDTSTGQLSEFDLIGGVAWVSLAPTVIPLLIDETTDRAFVRIGCSLGWLPFSTMIAQPITFSAKDPCFDQAGTPLAYDPAHQRVLSLAAQPPLQTLYTASTNLVSAWSGAPIPSLPAIAEDPARHRVLLFGGITDLASSSVSNGVLAIDEDDLSVSVVHPGLQLGMGSLVIDQETATLYGVGAQTWQRTLEGAWRSIGPGPGLDNPVPAWDSASSRLLTIGTSTMDARPEVASHVVAADPAGSPIVWNDLDRADQPPPRSGETGVSDLVDQRIFLIGGGDSLDSTADGDVWDFDARLGWKRPIVNDTRFTHGGASPRATFDGERDRVFATDGSTRVDLMSMAEPFTWITVSEPIASDLNLIGIVYDPQRDRIVALLPTSTVLAVDFVDLTLHRFCGAGFSPSLDNTSLAPPRVERIGDQMILEVNGGLFTFDLATPYCDGVPIQ